MSSVTPASFADQLYEGLDRGANNESLDNAASVTLYTSVRPGSAKFDAVAKLAPRFVRSLMSLLSQTARRRSGALGLRFWFSREVVFNKVADVTKPDFSRVKPS
jgi:hypothetical protein